jgi:NhaP-type Na+/H+ or K+/H+ antiporter
MLITGLRGAMSFALVESIPLYSVVDNTGSRYKPELKACCIGVIMFSMFVMGGISYRFLESQQEGGGTSGGVSTKQKEEDGGGDEEMSRVEEGSGSKTARRQQTPNKY